MAMHTRATPGVYAIDRSSRVLTGLLLLISILPPRCIRNVRSDTCTTFTPSMARRRSTICCPCRSSLALNVRSRVSVDLPMATTSMAPMSPPALPMAEVILPSIPGWFRISSRTVRLWLAVGAVCMMPPCSAARGSAPSGAYSTPAPQEAGIYLRSAVDERLRRERLGNRAGERLQAELAAVGVERQAVMAQERVAEDAVEARTRVVDDHRQVVKLGGGDAQRRHGGGGPARPAPERLELHGVEAVPLHQADRRGERRGHDDDARPGIQQKPAVVGAVDHDRHDPDAQPGLEGDQDVLLGRRRRSQPRETIHGGPGDVPRRLEQETDLEGVGGRGAEPEVGQGLAAEI